MSAIGVRAFLGAVARELIPCRPSELRPGFGPVRPALRRVALTLPILAAGCSAGNDRVAVVDGVEISSERFDALHASTAELDDDERVGSALVLILQEAFSTRAEAELDVRPPPTAIAEALDGQRAALEARGSLDDMLQATNQTEARLQVNAELDTLRDLIGETLVRGETDDFDLAAAERAFLVANSEICIRQIQLDSQEDVPEVLARLSGGEAFDEVARQLSIDPFVSRDGGVGAGGDLGCSAPTALPSGLDEASLDAPLDQPTGPVTSSVGVHVIEVYQRTEPDLDASHDEVIEAAVIAQGPELFRLWAVRVLQDIQVEVDQDIGRWAMLPETDPVPTVVPPYRLGDIVDG